MYIIGFDFFHIVVYNAMNDVFGMLTSSHGPLGDRALISKTDFQMHISD